MTQRVLQTAGAHLAVLVALARHDDGGHSVLHKQHIVRGQRQREGQPARLHATAAVELQICMHSAHELGKGFDAA